jgi:polar amino acid transport system substrate-binding protein
LKKSHVISIALLVLALIVVPVIIAGCGTSTTSTTVATTATTAATTATTAAPSTDTTAAASTDTTVAASTDTTAAAAGTYDINAVVAGIKVDDAAAALVPANYKSAAVKVGSDSPYPPWEMFVGETTQFTGFDYDLAQAMGAKLGVKFEFTAMKFASLLTGLQAGNIDVIMSSMYDDLTRQKQADFVDYAKDGTALLVAKGNPEKIATWMDLSGKAVGAEKGTTQAAALAKLNTYLKGQGKAELTVNEYPDQPTAILAIKSGNVVADLTDTSTGAVVAATTDNGSSLELVVDPNPPAGLGFELKIDGIAIGKSNTGLRDAIQKALQSLMDDGTYKTIIDHYGLQPYPKADVNASTDPGSPS